MSGTDPLPSALGDKSQASTRKQEALPFVNPGAAEAAAQLRAFIADPTSFGPGATAHLLLARPRRSLSMRTWWIGLSYWAANRTTPSNWQHTMLPGWEYTTAEMRTEMLEDLDHLAATGELPKEASR